MIINIIAILLLVGGTLSSLPVYGSISMIDDNTISINLHVNKTGLGDDLNELIAKLKEANVKPRIYLELGEKIIEINNKADNEQDYFEVNFGKVKTSINIAKDDTPTLNKSVNTRKHVLKEIFSKTTCNNDFASTTSRSFISKLVDDINEILRRAMSLIQERGTKKIHQDSIYYEDLRHSIIPERYQSSMNLNREFKYYVPSQILSNIELTLERERLNSKSKLLFEYTKSIQNSLSRLTRLLDVKLQQLHDDFDNSFRWKLLNLQKQAEFFLENLIEEKQQQYLEKNKNSEDNFSIDKSKNGVSSDEDIEIKKASTLHRKNIKNFSKSDKTDKIDKTKRIDKNIKNDKLAPKIETRIMSHPQVKNISSHDFENKSSSAIKINLINKTFIANKSTEIKADLVNRKISQTKKLASTPYDKSLANNFEDHRNRSSEAKKVRAILSGKNISNKSTLKRIDKQKRGKTRVILHKSSRKNVIVEPKTPSRRTLQILVPSDKNKDKKQKNHHLSRKKIESNSREEIKARIDSISAMDEILEAVDEVLPTENPVEISPKELKKTIPKML